MAKSDFVLNVGDDNVVLTHFVDSKVANAWMGSPDPAMAIEELGEALARDPKARISILFDTLDQSFKEEHIPRVGVLDRRKLLARHINMAFPGANLRGARLVSQSEKKTLIYELASIPLDGCVPGWLDFVQSLPNEAVGNFTIAAENVDLIRALAPKVDDAPPEGAEPVANHWRHFIGINVTGGLRQIIEKNGRLSLTRLTQAPPPETPPEEFADMIIRDFKATITYIRRLGYQVGEALDVVMLTTPENKVVLEDLTWDGARSVSVYTPYEAGMILGLGSLGREEQAYCDVLHAAWFVSKRKPTLPLTRSAALGDTSDDIRDLAYLVAPYAAGMAVAAFVGWSAWTGYEYYDYAQQNAVLNAQLSQVSETLKQEQDKLGGIPHAASDVRNVVEVVDRLDAGKFDLVPLLARASNALSADAVVMSMQLANVNEVQAGAGTTAKPGLSIALDVRLSDLISTADEAVQVAQRVHQRLGANFAPDYTVEMTTEPVGAQAAEALTGGLGSSRELDAAAPAAPETFRAAFLINKVGK